MFLIKYSIQNICADRKMNINVLNIYHLQNGSSLISVMVYDSFSYKSDYNNVWEMKHKYLLLI